MFSIPALVNTIGLIFMYFNPLRGEKLENLREQHNNFNLVKLEGE